MDINENPSPFPTSGRVGPIRLGPDALNPDTAPPLRLSTPADVAVAIPHLLGFHPRESVVVIALSGDSILCVMRMDLDACGDLAGFDSSSGTYPAAEELSDQIAGRLANTGAEAAIVMLFTTALRSEVMDEFTRLIAERLSEVPIACHELLHIHEHEQGEHFSSWLCDDLACIPDTSLLSDGHLGDALAAEFVGRGRVVMESREQLVMSVRAADPGFSKALRAAVEAAALASVVRIEGGRGKERWRDEQIHTITEWLAEMSQGPVDRTFHPASDEVVLNAAALLVGLSDVRIRDTVMHRLLVRLPSRSQSWDGFAWVLRELAASAPDGWRAPVATLAGLSMWQSGDGARALECLRLALEDDESYSLGQLLIEAVCGGLPPETWAQALRGLSERECRYGSPASSAQPRRSRRRSRRAS